MYHKKIRIPSSSASEKITQYINDGKRYYFNPVTQEDKKGVLDYVDDPNFQDYVYLRIPEDLRVDWDKIPEERIIGREYFFISMEYRYMVSVLVDADGYEVIGTKDNPYRIYRPERDDIEAYVCYDCSEDGSQPILPRIKKCLERVPQEYTSLESVIALFQWANNKRDDFSIVPRNVKLKTLYALLQ
jgi:hypothetical protein